MDMVTLDDSDDESGGGAATDESEESEYEVDVTDVEPSDQSGGSRFHALLGSMLKDKFKMDEQVDMALTDVKERLDKLEDPMQEVCAMKGVNLLFVLPYVDLIRLGRSLSSWRRTPTT